jgi:hypothetical protein
MHENAKEQETCMLEYDFGIILRMKLLLQYQNEVQNKLTGMH